MLKDYFYILGVFVGLASLIFGLYQYTQAQKWKRAEFVSKEVNDFVNKREIKIIFQMLDYSSRYYVLPDFSNIEGKSPSQSNQCISNQDLISALVIHTERDSEISENGDNTSAFSMKEVYIRDMFDTCFDGLERFEHFIQVGLITHSDISPYIIYYMRILGDSNNDLKPPEFRSNVRRYLDFYGYEGVQSLLSRFGYDT